MDDGTDNTPVHVLIHFHNQRNSDPIKSSLCVRFCPDEA